MNYLKTYTKMFEDTEYGLHPKDEPRYSFVLNHLSEASNINSLLDIGSGRGTLLKEVNSYFPHISLSSIDLFNFHNLDFVEFTACDITQSIPIKTDRKFSLVTCLDVLEHISRDKIEVVLDRISQLGDRFLFTIANHSDIVNGQELHLIQEPSPFWNKKLKVKFEIIEFSTYYDWEDEDKLMFYECVAK